MEQNTIYCPYCGSEKVYSYDSLNIANYTQEGDDMELDNEMYAYGQCFECKEKFNLRGTITWHQPTADKTKLPQFKGWTIYDAVKDKVFIENKIDILIHEINGGPDPMADPMQFYISDKGFYVCRLRDGRFYAVVGRGDSLETDFNKVVAAIEEEVGTKAIEDKRFIGVWSTYEYPQNEIRILTMADITADQGYGENDLAKVNDLQEGETASMGMGGHTIMRLPDSFSTGMVTVPLNENGTVSLTKENKV